MSQYDKCLTGPFLLLRLPSISIVLSLESIIASAGSSCGTTESEREKEKEKEKHLWQKKSPTGGDIVETTKMPQLTKLYTMAEASEHNTKDDCWVVIDGKVPLLPKKKGFFFLRFVIGFFIINILDSFFWIYFT